MGSQYKTLPSSVGQGRRDLRKLTRRHDSMPTTNYIIWTAFTSLSGSTACGVQEPV
jgi:hypothetical protein